MPYCISYTHRNVHCTYTLSVGLSGLFINIYIKKTPLFKDWHVFVAVLIIFSEFFSQGAAPGSSAHSLCCESSRECSCSHGFTLTFLWNFFLARGAGGKSSVECPEQTPADIFSHTASPEKLRTTSELQCMSDSSSWLWYTWNQSVQSTCYIIKTDITMLPYVIVSYQRWVQLLRATWQTLWLNCMTSAANLNIWLKHFRK